MDTNRRRIKKNIFGESNIDEIFNGSDDMRINTFNIIIDRLSNELGRRQKSYGELEERFGVLNKLEYLENDKTVLLKNVGKEIKTKAKEKLENIRKNNLISTYPNLDIALRIFLCIPATNCSGERSFSTLKRIKNYYRNLAVAGGMSNSYIRSNFCSLCVFKDSNDGPCIHTAALPSLINTENSLALPKSSVNSSRKSELLDPAYS
ncbi:hypothetical protein CBL_05122 [Carabus blaptoides fortunei]